MEVFFGTREKEQISTSYYTAERMKRFLSSNFQKYLVGSGKKVQAIALFMFFLSFRGFGGFGIVIE
jgi:hypothetical protein